MFGTATHYAKMAEQLALKEAKRTGRKDVKAISKSNNPRHSSSSSKSVRSDNHSSSVSRHSKKKSSRSVNGGSTASSSSKNSGTRGSHRQKQELPQSITVHSQEKQQQDSVQAQGQRILEALQEAIDIQVQQEKYLSGQIQLQMERSQARYTSGNNVGAVLSMKKVKKFQQQLLRVTEAIDYLESKQEELEAKLLEANFEATATATSMESYRVSRMDLPLMEESEFDVSAGEDQEDVIVEVQPAATKMTPKDLLEPYKECHSHVQKILTEDASKLLEEAERHDDIEKDRIHRISSSSIEGFSDDALLAELEAIPNI